MAQELKEALAFMIELMEMGLDYDDASHQTCVSYEVDPFTLQTAYDNFMVAHGITME